MQRVAVFYSSGPEQFLSDVPAPPLLMSCTVAPRGAVQNVFIWADSKLVVIQPLSPFYQYF